MEAMFEQTDPQVAEKLEWWQELKLGLFIHWGIYSVWGTVESWPIVDKEPYGRESLKQWDESGHDTNRFMQMYFDQSKRFNPEGFDPEPWALAARKAGMKYVVFTTKHHDGFCMYDTRYTDFRASTDL
ncbi:MAG: alpha-L-fucosidase, partial [Verrucomicrobia bacterium]|nr:alpha-L-fucosidase [Verrucomicrobiota bacterium]